MKKIFSLILLALVSTTLSAHAVKTYKISEDVQAGIKKYRAKNYAGALTDFKKAIAKNPDDSFAYYYLGNLYAVVGKSAEASASYAKVIELKEIPGLVLYAVSAQDCLMDETKCGELKEFGQSAELTNFIRSKEFMDQQAKEQITDNEIQNAKDVINANKDGVDFSKFKYLNDASTDMPSDKEIADAVRTLAKVGFNPLAQTNYLANGFQNDNFYSLPNLLNSGVGPEVLQNYLTGSMFASFGPDDSSRGY